MESYVVTYRLIDNLLSIEPRATFLLTTFQPGLLLSQCRDNLTFAVGLKECHFLPALTLQRLPYFTNESVP